MSKTLTSSPAADARHDLTEKDGLCGICPAGCWVTVSLREGRMHSVRPLKDHPLGMICPNGVLSAEIVNDPDRLREAHYLAKPSLPMAK